MAMSTRVQLSLIGAGVLLVILAVVLTVYLRSTPRPDPEIAKLEQLIEAASMACLSNIEVESAAKVKAELDGLVKQIKTEGGITSYRAKRSGADKSLPPELKPAENAQIRRCMDQYMPGIFKAIGINVSKLRVPNPLQLRFNYAFAAAQQVSMDDTVRINLQTARRIVDEARLIRQAGGYFFLDTAYPEENEKISGTVVRDVRGSTTRETPVAARFCLNRPPALPTSQDDHFHLDCVEGGSCSAHFPSSEWLVASPCVQGARPFTLVDWAFAAEGERRWAVPSAATLAVHREQLKGVGYTIFTLETDVFRDPATIGLEVDLRVNGIPILEDGLAPSLRPVPHDVARPFRYTFALESLDFQGAEAGCEAISLTLTPRLKGGTAKGPALTATLAYVALRDSAEQKIGFGQGTLTWSARYVIPSDEWSHEAFIGSVTYAVSGGENAAATARQEIVRLKRAFDGLGLKYNEHPLVGVMRPPLTRVNDQLAYGLAAGVVQPSGQVRFTFPYGEANTLAETLLEARSTSDAARRVITPSRYVYKAAGNPKRQTTPTPPGVCGHMKT